MNRKILIEGLEQGPAEKSYGDWRFSRFRKNTDRNRLRIVEREVEEKPPPPSSGRVADDDPTN